VVKSNAKEGEHARVRGRDIATHEEEETATGLLLGKKRGHITKGELPRASVSSNQGLTAVGRTTAKTAANRRKHEKGPRGTSKKKQTPSRGQHQRFQGEVHHSTRGTQE